MPSASRLGQSLALPPNQAERIVRTTATPWGGAALAVNEPWNVPNCFCAQQSRTDTFVAVMFSISNETVKSRATVSLPFSISTASRSRSACDGTSVISAHRHSNLGVFHWSQCIRMVQVPGTCSNVTCGDDNIVMIIGDTRPAQGCLAVWPITSAPTGQFLRT